MRYVLFDLLYHAGRCLLREPLARRREVLAELCRRFDAVDVRFSEGVVGPGRALCAGALAQGDQAADPGHAHAQRNQGNEGSHPAIGRLGSIPSSPSHASSPPAG
jgi:hypothetical protein